MRVRAEVLGPEHEFSVVDDGLGALPIVDRVLKGFRGRFVNRVAQSGFTLAKELQMHAVELKPNAPFRSSKTFEETMQKTLWTISPTSNGEIGELTDAQIWKQKTKQLLQRVW